ncbi:lytic murein transglycosylase [uncultured Desulfovibrio sp.]|mgnify:FL=1|uniref:lytic murein transglycosylase n=1 Tax=uncultured Desulfovibrio sp. TaxID=167968 RepID=UPI0026277D38|nr:lytic murein transglycosylase [uncultured Desulfovibrio sp.]
MMLQPAFAVHSFCRRAWSVCGLAGCLLLCACSGAQTAASRGGDGITSYDLPSSPAATPPAAPSNTAQGYATPNYSGGYAGGSNGAGTTAAPSYGEPQSQAPGYAAPAPTYAPSYQQSQPQPAAGSAAIAPAWRPLADRLAADGLSGPRVDALLATLSATPTQSPMGRKMRELYNRKFFPKPPSTAPAALYYKGVLTDANVQLCRQFVAQNKRAFDQAEARFGVPSSIAVSLLFVETRLGKVLADVPENAFYTLASMSVTRQPSDIPDWLPRMPGYQEHLDWFAEIMPKRADWAYKEVKALVEHMLRDNIDPHHLPSSIYGAVGLCQFMPSNIATYGADGDGDGKVDLFTIPDAVASLSNYLAKHGWKPGLPRTRQHQILMAYNHAAIYANTILALSDMINGAPSPEASAKPAPATAGKPAPAKTGKAAPAKAAKPAAAKPASKAPKPVKPTN